MDVEAIDAKMEAMCTEMEVSEEIYRYGLSENPHIIMVRPPTRCSWHLASSPRLSAFTSRTPASPSLSCPRRSLRSFEAAESISGTHCSTPIRVDPVCRAGPALASTSLAWRCRPWGRTSLSETPTAAGCDASGFCRDHHRATTSTSHKPLGPDDAPFCTRHLVLSWDLALLKFFLLEFRSNAKSRWTEKAKERRFRSRRSFAKGLRPVNRTPVDPRLGSFRCLHGYFGPGSLIGEAAHPGPGLDDAEADVFAELDTYLDDLSALGGPMAHTDVETPRWQESPKMLDALLHGGPRCEDAGAATSLRPEHDVVHACKSWHEAIVWRGQRDLSNDDAQKALACERRSFAAAHSAIASFARKSTQECTKGDESGAGNAMDGESAEGCQEVRGLPELKRAVREVDLAVRRAFDRWRTPTQGDIDVITTRLQDVATAVLAGRRESASHVASDSVVQATAVQSEPSKLVGKTVVGRRSGHRRRGSGKSAASDSLDIFYGNITSMSEKAEHFLLSLKDAIWLAGECHIRQQDVTRRCQEWLRRFDITAAPATPSDSSDTGTYGGVIAASRKHLSTGHVDGDVAEAGWMQATDHDLAGRTLHLQGVDVLVLGGYARNGEYQQQAAAVARVTRNGRLPFIWLADFNHDPKHVQEEPWLEQLDACVMVPDTEVTCHAGSGSLIDFGIVSRCLAPYVVRFASVPDVPWGPHDGIRMRLRRSPRAVMIRTLRRPRSLTDAAKSVDGGERAELQWDEAWTTAQRSLRRKASRDVCVASAQQQAAAAMGFSDAANRLGEQLATWARATELQAMAVAGVSNGPDGQAFRGRGLQPKFRDKPLAACPRLVAESLCIPGGYGATARLWATCRALSSKLRVAILRSATTQELCLMRARIVTLVLRGSSGVRCAWEGIEDKADATAGLFAILCACNPIWSITSLDAAIGTFERLERAEAARGSDRAREAWHKWVSKSIAGGAKRAHRWANAPNATIPLITSPLGRAPADVACHHTNTWASQWQAGRADKVAAAFEAVRELRERALAHPTHGAVVAQIVPSTVRQAAQRFRKGTCIGVDCVTFQDIEEASDESLEELCRIMRGVVMELATPLQIMLVLGSLLGKKLGGTRCIAICATFYRLLMAIMKADIRDWDSRVGLDGDSALPGRSPHDETAWRQLLMELACLQGKSVGQMLWDVAKFFDSLDVPILIERAEGLGFPLDQLTLAMQMHRAPRALRAAGTYGPVIEATGVSILAGCTTSTSLSRAFLRDDVACSKSKHAQDGDNHVNQHVDDVNQVVIADTDAAVVARCVRMGLSLTAAFTKSRLQISDKSTVVASSAKLAQTIAAALQRAGQPITPAASAEDLGISSACGARRAVGAVKKRLKRGMRRSRRVGQLSAANPKAAKLYQTGVRPQQSYGAAIQGAAPSHIQSMRRAAAASVAKAGTQPCTTTLLAWRLGAHRDPATAMPLEQVKLWMKLWARATRQQRRELRAAWVRALPRILLGGVHWKSVTGPMQATMAVLGQVGWRPIEPDKWITEDGREYGELEWSEYANAGILETLSRAFETATWRSAAPHFLGGGLAHGTPSLEPARSARRWLAKRERYAEVKALDCVICGGVWAGCRSGVDMTCMRCGEADVTMFHQYWSCSKLASHNDDAVRKTNWMQSLFAANPVELECLWGRGILPANLLPATPRVAPGDIETVSTPNFVSLASEQLKHFTDGSGGPRWVPQATKCVGSALATVKLREDGETLTVEDVGLMIAAVPGRPTVPRAELWAAVLSAQAAPHGGDWLLRSDAAYVVKGIHAHGVTQSLKEGQNGDLWTLLDDTLRRRSLRVQVAKVKSHAEKQVLAGRLGVEDFIGNLLADAGAGIAAESSVDGLAAQHASLWETRAFLIAKRLAVLEAEAWEARPKLVPAPAPLQLPEVPSLPFARSQLQQTVDRMGHRLQLRGGFVHCSRCRRRRKATSVKYWISSHCNGAVATEGKRSETKRGVPIAPDADAPLVTPAKRRRLVAEQRQATREAATERRAIEQQAWQHIASSMRSSADEMDAELGGIEGAIDAHSTHDCVACGGFVGCTRCGAVVSTRQHGALHGQCRGWMPQGSAGVINRLVSGRVPRGDSWPNGAVDPRPKRIRSRA